MKRYLFAKQFEKLSVDELMSVCADIGFDGPTLLLREGFWTTPDNLESVKPFVERAKDYGLEVKYCDSPFATFDENDEKAFAVLAENGIENIRLGYMSRPSGVDVRDVADKLKVFVANAYKLAEKYGVRAIIQLHGWFYPQSATAAYPAIKDYDPRYLGIKMDPGNHICQEGFEFWDYQTDLLGDYICALGAKSAGMFRDGDINVNNGWVKRFVPAQEGAVDYREIYSLLLKNGFDGPTILMPFYYADNYELMVSTLRDELKYFDNCYEVAKKEVE
ncbi:MAG: sugar phosphate isomerase/epimerase [Ruminococcaceae bacterium]|nr:sugar phosphate isomerase/epimerase [Oscillospiraceae bacterium]